MAVLSEYAVQLSGNTKDTITYITIDEEQYNNLIDVISNGSSDIVTSQNKTTKKLNDNYDGIIEEITDIKSENAAILQSINEYKQLSSDSCASLNGDVIEMQYVQTFFLSLIFGIMIPILFFIGLKK